MAMLAGVNPNSNIIELPFDEPTKMDPDYIPDDAIGSIKFLNTATTNSFDSLREYEVLRALGMMVWSNIKNNETLDSFETYKEVYIAWRKECIDKLEGTLEGLFPNRWEIQYVGVDLIDHATIEAKMNLVNSKGNATTMGGGQFDNDYAMCYIHFPEVLITNANEEQWTILDYYVMIRFNYRMGVNSIKGYRATKLPVEYIASYTFSHSKTASNSFCKFCFGHTDLDTLVAGLFVSAYDEISIELFLQNLTDYLSWESLDGVPFYHINNLIKLRYGKGRAPLLQSSTVLAIYRSILSNREDIEIEVSLNGLFSTFVPVTDKLIGIVTKYTPKESLYPLDKLTRASIYPSGNVMDDHEIESLNRENRGSPLFTFKGKDVVLTVVQDKKDEKDECEKYADMRLVSEVANHISIQVNNFMYEYSWAGLREKGLPKV